MPPRIRNFFVGLGLIFLYGAAAPLYHELTQRNDIWWTPMPLLVPLGESSDRVEVYVRGKPLATLLEKRQLRLEVDGGASEVTARDVAFRFNNWDRMRARRLPLLLAYAAGCGIAVTSILIVLTGRLAYRPERDPKAAT